MLEECFLIRRCKPAWITPREICLWPTEHFQQSVLGHKLAHGVARGNVFVDHISIVGRAYDRRALDQTSQLACRARIWATYDEFCFGLEPGSGNQREVNGCQSSRERHD